MNTTTATQRPNSWRSARDGAPTDRTTRVVVGSLLAAGAAGVLLLGVVPPTPAVASGSEPAVVMLPRVQAPAAPSVRPIPARGCVVLVSFTAALSPMPVCGTTAGASAARVLNT